MAERKRLDSSMTYEEYVKAYDRAPRKPSLKPKQTPELLMDDFDLQSEDTQTDISPNKLKKNYNPEHIIHEVDEDVKTPTQWIDQPLPRGIGVRHRTQSENIQYTFISFIENRIERKRSRNFE